jgi:hypothetical protein
VRMSRSWEKFIKVTPRFIGTDEERKTNVESHDWKRVDLAIRYGIDELGVVVECADCGILASGTESEYPCGSNVRGELPPRISFDTYMNQVRDQRSIS